jgi:hypothetical protein
MQFNVSVSGNASVLWAVFAHSSYEKFLTTELSSGENVICCSRAVSEREREKEREKNLEKKKNSSHSLTFTRICRR